MNKTIIERQCYEFPDIRVHSLMMRRCIATSVTGSTERFQDYDQQMESFTEINQGDF